MQNNLNKKINFFNKQGYCIIKLLDNNDLLFLEKSIQKKLFSNLLFNQHLLSNYHKLVNEESHKNKMNSSNRYIKINNIINSKLSGRFSKTLVNSLWGHSNFKLYWVGDTKKKELKAGATGFRISRPELKIKSDDAAGVHLDKNIGGQIRNEMDLVLTLWVPIKGFSSKYTLRIAPKSHLINHKTAYKKNKKITPIIEKNYEKKFSFIRPRMKKGEVLFLHPNLLHGGSTNYGVRSRVSLDIRAINQKKLNLII